MAKNELKISIIGTLNPGKSIDEINAAIKGIEKKINKIKLNVNIDPKLLQSLKQLNDISFSQLNREIATIQKTYKQTDGTIVKLTQRLYENQEVREQEKKLTESQNKALEKQIALNKEVLDLYQKQAQLKKTTVKTDEQGNFLGQTDTFKNTEEAVKITKQTKSSGEELIKVTKDLAQAQKNAQRELMGTNKALKNLNNVTEQTVIETLKLNGHVTNQEVLGASLNRTTGQWTVTLKESSKQQRVMKGEIDKVTGSIYKQSDAIKQNSSANLGFMEQFKIALTRVPVWMGAMTLFYGSLHQLRDMIEVIQDVDKALTNMMMVMDRETTNFNEMLDNAIVKAKELGKTVTDVLDSFTQAAKSGLGTTDIGFLSEASLITSNVGEMEAADATQYLIAAIEQMNLSYKDSMSIIDSWNNLSNKNATTVRDLAEGWSRAAAVARNFGEDQHTLNAAISALTQVTRQSGNEIGNFIKSAFPRLLSSDVQNTLESIGIAVRDANGQMRNALSIYQDVAKAMDEGRITTEQFNQAALALGGRYHVTRVQTLIESMRRLNGEQSLYEKILNDSIDSVGSAVEENLTYLQSIEAQQNRVTASFQEFALTAGDAFLTPAYREVLDVLNSLALSLTSLVERFGLLPPLFGIISTGILIFNKNLLKSSTYSKLLGDAKAWLQLRIEALTNSINKANVAVKAQTMGLSGLTKVTKGASVAINTLATSMKGFLISTGIGIGIVALTSLIGKLIEKFTQAKAEQRELEQQTEELTLRFKSNRSEIEQLVDEYKKLNAITERNAQEEHRYIEVSNRLGELIPSIVEGKTKEGNVRLRNVEAIEKEVASLRELSTAQANIFIAEFPEKVKEVKDNIEDLTDKIEDLYRKQTPISSQMGTTSSLTQELTDPKLMRQNIIYLREMEAAEEDLLNMHVQLANSILERDGVTQQLTDTQIQFIQNLIDEHGYTEETTELIKFYASTIADLTKKYNELTLSEAAWLAQQITEENIGVNEVDKLVKQIEKLKEVLGTDFDIGKVTQEQLITIESVINQVDKGSTSWEKHKNALKDVGIESEQVRIILGNLRNSEEDVIQAAIEHGVTTSELIPVYNDLGEIVSFVTESFSEEADAVDEVSKSYDDAISKIKSLNGLLNELNESHQLSADNIGFLIKEYPHLLVLLDDETSLRKAIQEEIVNEEKIAKQAVLNKLQYNTTFYNNTIKNNASAVNTFKKNYGIDLTNFKSLAQAKLAVDNKLRTQISDAWNKFYDKYIGSISISKYFKGSSLVKSFENTFKKWYSDKVYEDFNDIFLGGVSAYTGSLSTTGLKTPKDSDSARAAEDAQRRVLEVIQAQIDAYLHKAELLEDNIALEEYYLAKYEETDEAYRQRQANIVKLKQQQADYHKTTISYIEGQLKSNKKLNAEQRKELEKTLIRTQQAYYSLLKDIDSINKSIQKSYEKIADEVIDTYKKMYETMREVALENIDKELKTLENSHKKKMDMLDEELDQYEKLIQAKIDLIDQEEDEEDFQKELAKKQQERLELIREIDILAMDDSIEARSKVTELKEQLSEKEMEIEEFLTSRERELRKASLRQQLEDKREQIEAEREMETIRFESMRSQLEQEREELRVHYENLLNDERAFAQMREDILNGNIQNMNKQLNDFANFVKNNMSSIGQSISNNLLDKIKDAQNLLNSVNKSYQNVKTSTPSGSSGSSSSTKTSGSSSKTPTVGGKVKVATSNAKAYMDSYGSQVRPWADQAKAAGIAYGAALYLVNTRNGYGALSKTKNVKDAIAWVKLSDLVGLKEGGFTGNREGLAILHKKELVLNEKDTKNILSAVDIVRDLASKFKIPTISNIRNSTTDTSQQNYFNFRIDNLNGSREGADEFFRVINKELQGMGVRFV